MARLPRIDIAGNYYHVLNRTNARVIISFTDCEYKLLEHIIEEACMFFDIHILAYCIMPNHFHFVVFTQQEGELGTVFKWITQTHTQRWHKKRNTIGTGSLYQGRFKSFPIQEDQYLFNVIRYVERNPLTANLVSNPLNWKYSSLYRRHKGTEKDRNILQPIDNLLPKNYIKHLMTPISKKELDGFKKAINQNQAFGDDTYREAWRQKLHHSF